MSKNNKELYAELSVLVKNAEAALEKATKFANRNSLEFRLDSVGTTFAPKTRTVRSKYDEQSRDKNYAVEYFGPSPEGYWTNSSSYC